LENVVPASVLLPLASIAFIILALVFARNAHVGLKTGTVYVRSAKYSRDREPTFFWLGVAFSTIFAGACVAAVGVGIWATITLT